MRPASIALCLVLSVSAGLAAVSGCGGSSAAQADGGSRDDALCSVTAPAGCPSPVPTYRDVQPIIAQRCVVCHGADPNGPWPLSDYDSVVAWKEPVAEKIGDCEMPPADAGVPMTTDERQKILSWLQCGAPE